MLLTNYLQYNLINLKLLVVLNIKASNFIKLDAFKQQYLLKNIDMYFYKFNLSINLDC